MSHKWREIADLPNDLDFLRDRELESLSQVWAAQKATIQDQDRIKAFNAKLQREWAIETGIIEGVYTLDRGITQTLIERGIDSAFIPHGTTNRDPELVSAIIQAHADALEGLFAFVAGERELSTSYVKELHSALLRHQDVITVFNNGQAFEAPLDKGAYKKLPNNPTRPDGAIHEYCPPEHVASEMDRLIELHQQHERTGVSPHVEAAWIHHAFTQIHPFQDGNGRVARAIASLVFIKNELFPLVVTRDDREKYIDALEAADRGDLSQLAELFSRMQKRALTKAIGRSVDVKPVHSVDEAISATRDLLVNVGRIIPPEYMTAKDHAGQLMAVTSHSLQQLVIKLNASVARANSEFRFTVSPIPVSEAEIRSIAAKLQYDPNLGEYCQAMATTLSAGGVASQIAVCFHGVGSAFRGLIVVAAFFRTGPGAVTPLTDDILRIDYKESLNDVRARYSQWLDQALIKGLAEWRRTLV